jgi:hypothetical protein
MVVSLWAMVLSLIFLADPIEVSTSSKEKLLKSKAVSCGVASVKTDCSEGVFVIGRDSGSSQEKSEKLSSPEKEKSLSVAMVLSELKSSVEGIEAPFETLSTCLALIEVVHSHPTD